MDFTVEMSMCMHSPHIPGRGSRGNQTLLLCCHPDKEGDDLEGTHLHMDWAGAENVLLLFEDGDIKKPGAAWLFLSSLDVHRPQVVETLKRHGLDLTAAYDPPINPRTTGTSFFWTLDLMKKVASELPGMSDLVLQHHMEVVTVPVGRLHAVSNITATLSQARSGDNT